MSSSSSKRKSSLDLEDVGLGLKMQIQQPTQPRTTTSSSSNNVVTGYMYDRSNGPIFGGSDIYQAAAASYASSFLPARNYNFFNSPSYGGRGLFTAAQWEELEKQTMIHKYFMASIPVPPQLLLSLSQSNSGLGGEVLRYSSMGQGLESEPWRCKRTDGKKWRCSRDRAPDIKYCERHAHKTRGRGSGGGSRKHVESSNSPLSSSHNNNNNISISSTPTSTASALYPLQRQVASQFPTLPSEHTRGMEWLMRGGTGSNVNQQWQQQQQHFLQTSSSLSSRSINRDNSDNKNVVSFEEKLQSLMNAGYSNVVPYIPDTSHLQNLDSDKTQTTRRFIDAWDNENKRYSPSSSLTLSMNGIDDRNDNDDNVNENNGFNLGNLGMMRSDHNDDGIMKFGGPLGEALCLGNASTMMRGNSGSSSLASAADHHGYSNTNSSSCSKGSCEDGNYAFNFIG